jgi:HPt (histidine-containing phosphotransfer) domain-containing protein
MPVQNENTVLDMDQLRNISMEDTELMRELVAALIEDATTHISKLQAAVEDADAEQSQRLAHYVKGACANVGAASMAAILRNIEVKAKSGDFSGCRSSLIGLSEELTKFSSEAAAL